MSFQKSILELIRQVSTNLPADVAEALVAAKNQEEKESRGELSLETILKNIQLAKEKKVPICQDTGFPSFFVRASQSINQEKLRADILAACREATAEGLLRPNAVDPMSGKNSGDNIGEGYPAIYFDPSFAPQNGATEGKVPQGNIEISLLLKGGGSENVSDQVSLPMETDFGFAGRDLDGAKKAILQIVKNAQGKGCAPGIISVVLGSDRAGSYVLAKKNLMKRIGEENPDPDLAKLEAEIIKEANELGIGPMGLDGKSTLLDCKVAAAHRLPASFFVTVAYSCWATRRGSVVLNEKGEIIEDDFNPPLSPLCSLDFARDKQGGGFEVPDNVKKLTLPLNEEQVRELKAGDVVLLSGKLFTGRDRVHEFALKNDLPHDLKGSAIYHCGPIAIKDNEPLDKLGAGWKFAAAGPTTSARLDNYEAEFIEKTGIRAVIGKGGMGERTAEAMRQHGCVYLHAIGGAAAFYADTVKKVDGVNFLEEFGVPEAMWEIEVEDFLAVVSIDARGETL